MDIKKTQPKLKNNTQVFRIQRKPNLLTLPSFKILTNILGSHHTEPSLLGNLTKIISMIREMLQLIKTEQ